MSIEKKTQYAKCPLKRICLGGDAFSYVYANLEKIGEGGEEVVVPVGGVEGGAGVQGSPDLQQVPV